MMRPSGPPPTRRSYSEPDGSDLIPYYSRPDQPCLLSFRVGDVVWARSNGRWALGVVVCNKNLLQDQIRSVPTYTVLTHGGSSIQPILVALSPLFGSLKPADTYTASLLHAEGLLPFSGTHHADVLELQLKAHAWIGQRDCSNRPRRVVS